MRRPRPGPARFDIADIVRAHRAELESLQRLTRSQKRALTDIAQCRTAVLGGHVDRCEACGYEHPAYNSCRNRHCPKCQALAQENWIEARRARMLDVRHFHVVFTLPSELRPLARFAPRVVFDALMRAAQRTLLALAKTRLRATVGATLVLHTWTRKLEFHPHVHAIVTGGGLGLDGASWCPAAPRFLVSVVAMGQVFRGKLMAALGDAYDQQAFTAFGAFDDPQGFARLMARLPRRAWNVYAKAPFKKGRHVLDYLGRYTHRVGIANSRLLAVSERAVTFRTKGQGLETVTPVEFCVASCDTCCQTAFTRFGTSGSMPLPPLAASRRPALAWARRAGPRVRAPGAIGSRSSLAAIRAAARAAADPWSRSSPRGLATHHRSSHELPRPHQTPSIGTRARSVASALATPWFARPHRPLRVDASHHAARLPPSPLLRLALKTP